jgi:3-oxoacyl-[acyl-carrier-protein] synthase II
MRGLPVITGLGIVSPIGVGVDAFWKSAVEGRSGIGTPTIFDASGLPPECQLVGEVRDFIAREWTSPGIAKTAARFSQFAVAAAKMSLADSGLPSSGTPADGVKVSFGTSINGQIDVGQNNFQSFLRGEEVRPWVSNEYPAHAATSHVAISLGVRAQTMTFATACAAGLDSIAWAAEEVGRGNARAVIAGGTEAPISAFIMEVFRSVGVLSRWEGPAHAASRPFDRLRSGLVLAEGAASVLVEDEASARERGATIYARILSSASVSEGHHLRKVDESGEGAARVILAALHAAELSPSDIDYFCAHGNSMQDYDAAETAGIKHVFAKRAWSLPISSIKSMCGQALAASGAMQVVTACLALRDQIIPPTINYEFPDPVCDLDYVPNVARRARIRHALIHTHSLGGAHVAMILGAPD